MSLWRSAMAGQAPNDRRSSQSFNMFAIHQYSYADYVLQNSRAFCILSMHIPAFPTKLNSTLNIDQDRALSTIAIELELVSDWFRIYCE